MGVFEPLFRNPHVLTILGNFWPRKYDFSRFPAENRLIPTDEDTRVLVLTQRPAIPPIGEVVLLHGLEGSSESGYIKSMAWDLLNAGFIAHRFNMRTCGGTAHLCKTLYHAGLTSDLRVFLERLRGEGRRLPVFLIGFSLGGNLALKLAGELGAHRPRSAAPDWLGTHPQLQPEACPLCACSSKETKIIDGVCAVSTPIDLQAGVRRLGRWDNRVYEKRFVKRMRARMQATGRYSREDLEKLRSLYELDDRITAPSFGFTGADHYYATQSAQIFLDKIRVPTLLIQAKDDTFIPFETFQHPALVSNPFLHLMATEHGGHLGFLSRRGDRFWLDRIAIEFFLSVIAGSRDPADALGSVRAG